MIQTYLETWNDFEVIASLDNAIEGFSYLQNHRVDLLFLDIQMPRMTGLELLKALPKQPKVVLTTAFREYGVEGFDLEVFDYLVKPISQELFQKTILKYQTFQEIIQSVTPQQTNFEEAYIFLKVGKEKKKIFLHEICFIEGLKDYVKVFTHQGMFVVYERLGYMEAKLPDSKFVRVHKSFIVALDKVLSYSYDTVKIQADEIPIGRVYKQDFIVKIEKLKL